MTTRKTLHPAPERPELEHLLEKARARVAAMSEEERDAMTETQARNLSSDTIWD